MQYLLFVCVINKIYLMLSNKFAAFEISSKNLKGTKEKKLLHWERVCEIEGFLVYWRNLYEMTIDMPPVMAQTVRTSRSSFSSSNGNETPLHNSATISNGDGYDSDGSNFAPL